MLGFFLILTLKGRLLCLSVHIYIFVKIFYNPPIFLQDLSEFLYWMSERHVIVLTLSIEAFQMEQRVCVIRLVRGTIAFKQVTTKISKLPKLCIAYYQNEGLVEKEAKSAKNSYR